MNEAFRREWDPQKISQYSFRTDLADALVVFFPRSTELDSQYRSLRQLAEETEAYKENRLGVPPSESVHPYEIPPAAGTWEELALVLAENLWPAIEKLSVIGGVLELIRFTASKFGNRDALEDGINGNLAPVIAPSYYSQTWLVCLVIADAVDRFGFEPQLRVYCHPQGQPGYDGADHPNGGVWYRIICSYPDMLLTYEVTGTGDVKSLYSVDSGNMFQKLELARLQIPEYLDEAFSEDLSINITLG